MGTPKVVFDTNIFISALLFGGNCRYLLEAARNGKIKLCTSIEILFELAKILKNKFRWSDKDIQDVIEGIGKFADIVKPRILIDVIKDDEADNRILECAVEADAGRIISGDKKHLLIMKKYKKVRIVSPAEMVKELRET